MADYRKLKVAAADLAAMAFAAQRINDGFYKESTVLDPETYEVVKKVVPNKDLMIKLLSGTEDYTVTDEDRALAQDAIQSLQQTRTLTILKGSRFSTFVSTLCDLFEQEMVNGFDVGLASYLPKVYNSQLERQAKTEKLTELVYSSQFLGKPGDKITFTLNVLETRYVPQYASFGVFGDDGNGNLISFLTGKEQCTVSGKYTAKIKRTATDPYHDNANVTTVNFVKAI